MLAKPVIGRLEHIENIYARVCVPGRGWPAKVCFAARTQRAPSSRGGPLERFVEERLKLRAAGIAFTAIRGDDTMLRAIATVLAMATVFSVCREPALAE